MNSFDQMGKSLNGIPRGIGISQAMQRELGETPPAGITWPLEANDPPILTQYVAQPPISITPPTLSTMPSGSEANP